MKSELDGYCVKFANSFIIHITLLYNSKMKGISIISKLCRYPNRQYMMLPSKQTVMAFSTSANVATNSIPSPSVVCIAIAL